MRPTLTAAGFAFLLLAAGCTGGPDGSATLVGPQDVPPPDANEGQIRGSVFDEQLLPVEEAQVALVDANPPRTARTDAAGVFVLGDLAPGAYTLALARLGFDSVAQRVDVRAGEVTNLEIQLKSKPVPGIPYHLTYIGQGYFACGFYVLGVLTVGNLNVCAWDTNHKPRFEFTTPREGLVGVLQEVKWQKNSALTSDKLIVYLWYKPVCNPTCTATKAFAATNGKSPIRHYGDTSAYKFAEDPVPLASATFPGGTGPELVVVFQQRMDHYLTAFYNAPGDLNHTAMPTS